jgi:hypothetical protein
MARMTLGGMTKVHAIAPEHPLAARAMRYAAPLFACTVVIAWVVMLASTHPAQYSDSIEQYNWAHSLQWGYWKHPPLPTWIMRGAIALMGASHWTAPLLAALCLCASAFFVWLLARTLLSERAANLAVVIWPLHTALSTRADVYNHNTVLVLFSTAMAWAAARASASGRTRDWLLAGALAGCGLLSKYTALVTIVGVLVALWGSGRLRSAREWRQVGLAGALALALFLPHVMWAANEHLTTLHYLEHSARHLEPTGRSFAFGRFLVMQLGMIAFILIAAAAARYGPHAVGDSAKPAQPSRMDRRALRAWMFGLIGVSIAAVAITVVVSGLKPQKMWGVHMLLFLPLWLAWRIDMARPHGSPAMRAGVTAAVLSISMMGYVTYESGEGAPHLRLHSPDRLVPAAQIAHAALADWRAATPCPLRIVTGNGFPAGLVSVYSGEYPEVLEEGDFTKSPWITPDQLRAWGAVEVYGPTPLSLVPGDASFVLTPGPRKFGDVAAAVWWRVIPPASACGG